MVGFTTTWRGKRIGPQMSMAAFLVRENPGCSKMYVAERISPCEDPRLNWAHGYNPVNRAIAAGIIIAKKGKGGTYALYPVAEEDLPPDMRLAVMFGDEED